MSIKKTLQEKKAKADLGEAQWKEIVNKHRSEPISEPAPKKLPSKKNRNGNGNGKKKKHKKRRYQDALYHRLPGHYGANQ